MTQKTKKYLVLFFLLILGLALPLYFANAQWRQIKDISINIAAALLGFVVQFILVITNLFFSLSAIVLEWVTSPTFIGISYTGSDNQFVSIGWGLTRSLANMAFVIALVAIGLGTALRRGEYQFQSALPRLIGIALLINFTPTICGVIIDASNIVMNFFLEETLGWGVLRRVFETQYSQIVELAETFLMPGAGMEFLIKGIVLNVFNILAGIVFFLFAALFAVRYVMLWTLIVLSPFAFFCYILPPTKKYFSDWWHQFIQWCFVGAIGAFFLYLGNQLLAQITDLGITPVSPGTTIGGISPAGWFDQILPYGIVVAFFYLGLMYALAIAPMGAKATESLAKKAGKWTGKYALAQTAGRLLTTGKGKEAAKALAEGKIWPVREAWQEFKEAKGLGKVGAGAKLAGKGLWKATVGLPVLGYPTRWAVRYAGARALEYGAAQEKSVEAEKKKLEERFGKDYERAAAVKIPPLDWQRKIALGRYLAETKGAKALEVLPEDELRSIIRAMGRYTPSKLEDIIKHKPELIKDAVVGELVKKALVPEGPENKYVKELMERGISEAVAIEKAAFRKAVDALKNEDIDNLSEGTIESAEFQEMVVRFKPWSFIGRLGEERGLDYMEKLQTRAEKIGIEEIAKTNPAFLRAAYTPGGQLLLRSFAGYESGTDINELIKVARMSKEALAEAFRTIARRLEEATPEEVPRLEREMEILRREQERRTRIVEEEERVVPSPVPEEAPVVPPTELGALRTQLAELEALGTLTREQNKERIRLRREINRLEREQRRQAQRRPSS